MRQDTQEASEEAAVSRDSAAGYAQSAEASRTAAKESEDNINAQVTGFDTHVAEKTSAAETAVEEVRKTAINAITTQQDNSVKTITEEGTKQTKAVNDAGITKTDEVNATGKKQVENVETAGQTAVGAVETQQSESEKAISDKATEQISAIDTAGETQIGAVEEAGNQQNVILTETAAQELIKLQEIATQFIGDHEQIETNREDIASLTQKKIQAWFPGKTTEGSTLTTKESALSDTVGNTILDLAGNEIGTTVEVVAPKPPYYLGDLWIADDAIYICITAREDGNFKNFDWMKILERK